MAKGTQILYLSGPCRWALVYPEHKDIEYDLWRIEIAPDDASLIALKSSGSRLEGKMDEEGRLWYKFRRKRKAEFKPGQIEDLGPPKVVTKDDDGYKPFTEAIGNGSEVTIKVEVYPSKKGVGTRLMAVCVDKHVPYEGKEANLGAYAF
jgi:hypothetical protein